MRHLSILRQDDLNASIFWGRTISMAEQEAPAPDAEFTIEKILDETVLNDVHYYLVQWEGYAPIYNTWEPEENFANAQEILREYKAGKQSSDSRTSDAPPPPESFAIEAILGAGLVDGKVEVAIQTTTGERRTIERAEVLSRASSLWVNWMASCFGRNEVSVNAT
jgi:hypothetical protein